jgi:hypothetical protein
MTFEIKDADNKPISIIEPLMVAGGHCVIIDADCHELLHIRPVEEVGDDDDDDVAHRVLTRPVSWKVGPTVSFLANFPKPGLYRAWGQFQHEDCSQQILLLKLLQDELELVTPILQWQNEVTDWVTWTISYYPCPATSYRIFCVGSFLSEEWIDDR